MTDKHERPFSPDGLPLLHKTGVWYGGHVQGIAADTEKGFMYYSYTTDFCKYGFDGELYGSVGGFIGHIGCMCFDPVKRKVYASLEYKNDEIGKGLHDRIGTGEVKDGFYIVIFNVDEINETGLSSEDCGAVSAVYLGEVVDDYHAEGLCGPHKYGCSGIDGVTLMPLPGCSDGKKYLAVAYGIYGDVNRTDNDNQVILFYDTDEIAKYARPLTQSAPHTSGPLCRFRTFLYTGNTTYGVQNLEYDPYTGDTFVCVYPGKKPQYENYCLFVIDGRAPLKLTDVKGTGEVGLCLSLLQEQSSYFPLGNTGIVSLSDGRFYISEPSRTEDGGNTTQVVMYSYSKETGFVRFYEEKGESMKKEQLIKQFTTPGGEYRGKPFWSWNGELEEKELRRQAGIMKEMGLGGYFMHSRAGLITEYLGDEWFDLINATADEGEKLGMEAWLYDEDRWPSGSAGGKVTADPQYRMKSLYVFESSPEKFEHTDDTFMIFEADLDGLKLVEYRRITEEEVKTVPPDHKILHFRVIPDQPSSNYNGTTYIDTMSLAAVNRFIELTHEQYKAKCGDRLGRSIKGIFTDEPHRGHAMDNKREKDGVISCATAYTDDFFEEFEKRYGYDMRPLLPELFYQKDGDPVSRVKLNYFDLANNLFVERFMKTINDWCNKNGIIFTGHVLHEDSLTNQTVPNGSLMRSYEHMGYPGIDLLTEHNRCYWVVKQLSSAARQLGKKWLLSELYGCTGWEFNLKSHKAVGDWQALFGINLRCQHLSWYTMEGESKRDYPASILHQSPWYKDYSFVETYFARFGLMMQQGKPKCDVLVINPIESVWCRAHLGWAQWISPVSPLAHEIEGKYQQLFGFLIRNHIDFDYGEEQMMIPRTSIEKTEDGAILHVGEASYKTVVVSGMLTIRPTTLKILEEFAEAGGKVVFAGDAPKYVDAVPSDEPAKLAGKCVRVPFDEEDVVTAVRREYEAIYIKDKEGENCGNVFVQERYDPDTDTYIAAFLNTDRENATDLMEITVTDVKEGYAPQLWSLETGERYAIPYEKARFGVTFGLKLEAAGSAIIVFTRENDAPQMPEEPETVEKYALDGTFEYECDEPQACVLDFARWRVANGEFSDEAEALKVDQQVRDHFGIEHRGGEMLQPWYAKLHDKKIYGDIELEYTFDIEKLPEGPVWLCGERPEFNSYFINGIKLECPDKDDFYIDNCFKKMPVPEGALRAGENKVTVKVAFMRTTNIEALYLIGRFGVKINGHKRTLTSLPARVGTEDLINYSMPFYTGCITYKLGAALFRQPGDGERIVLKAGRFKGGLVKVICGNKEQILAWEPYEADITDAVKSGADIKVVLVGTRRNLFGPLHLVPAIHGAYGPGHFVTGGDMWTNDYNLIPAHLGLLTIEHKK